MIVSMDFYIYESGDDGADLLVSLQKVISGSDIRASVRVIESDKKKEEHDFEFTPALFIGDHLLLEGDSPSGDELYTLVTVAARLYEPSNETGGGGGCCGGSCGTGMNEDSDCGSGDGGCCH